MSEIIYQVLNTGRKWAVFVSSNRVAKNSVYNMVRFIVPILLFLIFTPFLVRRMGTEGYGLWTLAISTLGLMGTFELGLSTAIAKYVAEYTANGDKEGISATVTTGFALYFSIGVLLTGPLYFLAPQLARFFPSSSISTQHIETSIRLASLGFIPLLLKSGGLAIPMGLERFEIPMVVTIGQRAFVLVAAAVAVALGGSVEDIVLSTLLAMWIVAVASLAIAWRMLRKLEAHILLSGKYLRKVLAFMVFTGTTTIGGQIFASLDRITVGAVLGIDAVTYYTVAIGIANKLLSFSGTLTSALMPAASSWHAVGDSKKLWDSLKRSTLAVALMSGIIVFMLLVFSRPFMQLWMGSAFTERVLGPLRILIIVYALISINAPAYHIANGIGSPWICALGALIGGITTIFLIFVLGTGLGLTGVALANAGYMLNFVELAYIISKINRPKKGW